jgi:anti-anti-sigma regulatory factor
MAVTVERTDGRTRVVLVGPLGVREAKLLQAALAEVAPTETVLIDDTGVAGVDTSAIQLLVAFARARRHGRRSLEVTDGALIATLRRLGMHHELAPVDRT